MSSPRTPKYFSQGHPALEDASLGMMRRYLGTWSDICFRPGIFFSHLSARAPFSPAGFAVFCVWLGTVIGTFWNLLAVESLWLTLQEASAPAALDALANDTGETPLWMRQLLLGQEDMWLELPRVQNQLWTTLLLAPVVAYFTLHLLAGLLHFTLQPFRASDEERVPFEVTFRFTAYAMAPMALCGIPAFGGFGSFWTWMVLGIAMSRLHRLRWLGTLSSVWLPVLFLSMLWNQEVLPKIAPPIAERLNLAWEHASPSEIRQKLRMLRERAGAAAGAADEDEDESAGATAETPPHTKAGNEERIADGGPEYPPMPAFDREHRVETREVDGFWQSERLFRSSRGPLRIQHRARSIASDKTYVEVRVRHDGKKPLELEIEHTVLGTWQGKDARAERAFSAESLPLEPSNGGSPASGRISGPWTALFPELAPKEVAVFAFEAENVAPQDVLQVGPTLRIGPAGVDE